MNTSTIQIENPTKAILDKLKENYSVKTYDEVIRTLIKRKHKSMFGVLKDAKFTTKEAIREIRKERDSGQ